MIINELIECNNTVAYIYKFKIGIKNTLYKCEKGVKLQFTLLEIGALECL